jgi:hypothetical protein
MYFNDPYKNQTEGVSKPSAEENIWSWQKLTWGQREVHNVKLHDFMICIPHQIYEYLE